MMGGCLFVRESLHELLKRFPVFLNKSSNSNFYKSESVFNEWFKKIDNDIFEVYLADYLRKPILIWREQDKPFEYRMHFVAVVDDLAQVDVYENGTVIYTKTYIDGDDDGVFYYSYESTSDTVMPTASYTVSLTTKTEYTLSKEYPLEHDESLDKIGSLNGVSRRSYTSVDDDKYDDTLPKYHNDTVEDDFHYLQRLLTSNLLYHFAPLPLVKLWNEIGVMGTISNRQNCIGRMTDTSKHQTADGDYDVDWLPRYWEHKDYMCSTDEPYTSRSIFLLAVLDNPRPVIGQDVLVSWKPVDQYAVFISKPFYYLIYVNDTLLTDVETGEPVILTDRKYTFDTQDFENKYNTITVKAYEDMETLNRALEYDEGKLNIISDDIVSNTVFFEIIGCDDATLFVATYGDDSNTGSLESPFATIDKAISSMDEKNYIINVIDGGRQLKELDITQNTVILSCSKTPALIESDSRKLYRVTGGQSGDPWNGGGVYLNMVNLHYKHRCCHNYCIDERITNYSDKLIDNTNLNKGYRSFNMAIDYSISCKICNYLELTGYVPVYADEVVSFTLDMLKTNINGDKSSSDDSSIGKHIGGETIHLTISDGLEDTMFIMPDNDAYTYTNTFDTGGVFTVNLNHEESEVYCDSSLEYQLLIYHVLDLILDTTTGELDYSTSKDELIIEYDAEDNNLYYTHEEDTTTISIDSNGDIVYEEVYDL